MEWAGWGGRRTRGSSARWGPGDAQPAVQEEQEEDQSGGGDRLPLRSGAGPGGNAGSRGWGRASKVFVGPRSVQEGEGDSQSHFPLGLRPGHGAAPRGHLRRRGWRCEPPRPPHCSCRRSQAVPLSGGGGLGLFPALSAEACGFLPSDCLVFMGRRNLSHICLAQQVLSYNCLPHCLSIKNVSELV